MLRLPFLDIFLRLIPEGLIYCWACYVFSKTPFDKKRWLLTGVILGFSIYVIRLLPIHFGVHTIFFFIVFIFISITINKIDALKSIPICLISVSSMYFFEWLNVYIVENLFQISVSEVLKLNNVFITQLYMYPSLLFLIFAIILINFIIKSIMGRISCHVSDGESIK